MVLGGFKFLGVPCHSIELDDLKVFMADDGSAKRIHFATSHAHALRKTLVETLLLGLMYLSEIL